jgi:DNA-binding MarR family transcriptional regulator
MNKKSEHKNEEIDKLIHEPARLKIALHLFSVENADFIYLAHKTGLSKGNLSSHLSKLEDAGYVLIEKSFVDKIPRTVISLTDIGIKAFKEYKSIITTILSTVD